MIKKILRKWPLLILALHVFLVSCGVSDSQKQNYTITGAHYDFIVMGDTRPNITLFETFLTAIGSLDVDTVVHLGDLVEFSSPVGFLSVQESLKNYLRSDINFIPVIGNHDMDGSGGNTRASLQLFNDVFGLPSDYLGYKKIDNPNYIFIILNSYLAGEENSIGPVQFSWLENTLESIHESTPSKPIFLFTHHPIYPAGYHPHIKNASEFNALLHKYNNVKAVFSGHEHLYYHEEVASGDHKIQYYISGGAGSPMHHVPKGLAIRHVLGVTVSPNLVVKLLDERGAVIAL